MIKKTKENREVIGVGFGRQNTQYMPRTCLSVKGSKFSSLLYGLDLDDLQSNLLKMLTRYVLVLFEKPTIPHN